MYSASSTASSVTEAPRRMFVPTWTWMKPSWPEPELSIGRELEALDSSHRCWDIKGPVLDLATRIYGAVQEELDLRSAYLVERERVHKPVLFQMYMTGRRSQDANPTLLFSCSREQPRRRAKEVVKDSGILREHPAVRLAHSKRLPQAPTPFRILVGSMKRIQTEGGGLFGDVYCISPVDRTCGVPVFTRRKDGSFRKATIGGIVQFGDTYYGLTVAHTFVHDESKFAEDGDDESSDMECSFDSDDDFSTKERREQADRRYYSSESGSQRSKDFSSFRTATLSQDLQHIDEDEAISSVVGTLFQYSIHTGLDWALIEIDNSRVDPKKCNAVNLSNEYEERTLWPRALVTTGPAERAVLAITGDKGVIQGFLSPNPIYMRAAQTRGFQELWAIHMTSGLVEGDCGSWVIDRENGQLYGQIVAGHPGSGVGYIIPASQIFESVWQTLGDALTLPSGNSTQSSAAIAGLASRREEHDKLEGADEGSKTYGQLIIRQRVSKSYQIPVPETRLPSLVPYQQHSPLSQGYTAVRHRPRISTLSDGLRHIIEDELGWLFSDENLSKDFMLRSYMDSQGYITMEHLTLLSSRLHGTNPDAVCAVCGTLPFLELDPGQDGLDLVRRRNGWLLWVLPSEQRNGSLQVSFQYPDHLRKSDHKEHVYRDGIEKGHQEYSHHIVSADKKSGDFTSMTALKSRAADGRQVRKSRSNSDLRPRPAKPDSPDKHSNDGVIARILQRNEKDAQRSEGRDKSPVDLARPVYTRMARRHLSLETLRVHRIDYEIDPADPDFVVVKRWVPEREQNELWDHTKMIRSSNIPSWPDESRQGRASSHFSDDENATKIMIDDQADDNPACNTLWIRNLPMDTSEEEMKAMFSKQRGYKRLMFRTKPSGPMCFVEFEDVISATHALHKLYGQSFRHGAIGIRLGFSKNPLGVRSSQGDAQSRSMTGTEGGTFNVSGGPLLSLKQSGVGYIPSVHDDAPGSARNYTQEIEAYVSDADPILTYDDPDLEEAIKRSKDDFRAQPKTQELPKSRGFRSKTWRSTGQASSNASDIGSETSSASKRTRDSKTTSSSLANFIKGGKR